MTGAAALHEVMNSFGLTAYESTSVPEDASFPYLTYTYSEGFFGDGEQVIQVSIYDQTTSNAEINAMGMLVAEKIGNGLCKSFDGGGFILRRGTPFMQAMTDPDSATKRRYIVLSIEWIAE